MQRLKVSVTEAFEAAGKAVKDDAVKADVRETGRLLLDAMSASLAKASDNLRGPSGAAEPGETKPPADPKPSTSE